MPRLSADQIKAGILHADPDVRLGAVRYFSGCHSPDTTVMPVVIQALEQYGRPEALRYSHVMIGLAQTEATVRWAFEELDAPGRDMSYLGVISRLLCDADPRLIAPYENQALARHGFFPAERDHMLRRVHNLSRGSEELWRELEAICEEGKDKPYAGDLRWDEAEDAVTALALRGPACADRLMASLAEEITEFEGNPAIWMQPLMARLAGELRHGPAVPLLVKRLHEDGEVLNEECVRALGRIGTDEVVRAIREAYPSANDHFRNYAIGALEQVHTDLCVAACIELLKVEEDPDLRSFLASALVGHFSTEGNEVLREALLADPDQANLRDDLLAACALTGQDFPELPAWRREAEEEARAREKRAREWMMTQASTAKAPAPARAAVARPPAAVKVGRNDPCPCGSGKKFKKCCLARDEGP